MLYYKVHNNVFLRIIIKLSKKTHMRLHEWICVINSTKNVPNFSFFFAKKLNIKQNVHIIFKCFF